MKKTILALAIMFSVCVTSFAQTTIQIYDDSCCIRLAGAVVAAIPKWNITDVTANVAKTDIIITTRGGMKYQFPSRKVTTPDSASTATQITRIKQMINNKPDSSYSWDVNLNVLTDTTYSLLYNDTFTVPRSGAVKTLVEPLKYYSVQVLGVDSALTGWGIRLAGSLDGTNFTTLVSHVTASGDKTVIFGNNTKLYPVKYLRLICDSVDLGTGSSKARAYILGVK